MQPLRRDCEGPGSELREPEATAVQSPAAGLTPLRRFRHTWFFHNLKEPDMRMLHASPASCKHIPVDQSTSPVAFARERVLLKTEELIKGGLSCADAIAFMEVPQSTYYDWRSAYRKGGVKALAPESCRPRRLRKPAWKPMDVKRVMDLRRKYPFMGKARIQAMLAHKGHLLSISTVGRILQRALAAGAIRPASFCEGREKSKRRRRFGKWARRWKYGAKARRVGELVQVDHMTFSANGQTLKEFRAVCPTSKFMVARVFSRATAGNAKRFLLELVGALPFPPRSLQVDGGSEFMAEFEDACEILAIPLHVLPPRRPQWNGCVERTNRSARIEFWNRYNGPLTVAAVSTELAKYEFFFNYQRPHVSLDYQTPNQYLVSLEDA